VRVDEFDYHLPEELIADRPPANREDSRLLVVRREEANIEHRFFRDLPCLLKPGDLTVVNNTRVLPARLWGKKRGGGARIEILLLQERAPLEWETIAQRAIRLSEGTVVEFPNGDSCEVVEALGSGKFVFRFHLERDWDRFLGEAGEIPLPPYIRKKRESLPEAERDLLRREDLARYQTTFAHHPGSAAAPTAGLHFTDGMFSQLSSEGIGRAEVTLHVGLDTFAPVLEEEVEDHKIHTEWCWCPRETVERIASTRNSGGRIVAVGTTTCRTLETYARRGWPAGPVFSNLFLKPGDRFETTDLLLTNFHLPRSTLLMMVSAFMGNDLRRRVYESAIGEGYRFYSYGDAMLIV
jgi:S-adenosylmethionine:tRNA ribosyltransferase-isomerase